MRLLFALLVVVLGGCVVGKSRITVENDVFPAGKSDQNYTNGVVLAYSPNESTTYEIGHKGYTPEDLEETERITDDRPYAGQLWAGYSRHCVTLCRTGGAIRMQTGIRVGGVGALSMASEIQKFVHNDLGVGTDPKGWRHQIETEVTVGVHHERRHSILGFGSGWWRGDVIGIARADVGTDITRARVGGIVRYGFNLPSVFGPGGASANRFGRPGGDIRLWEPPGDPSQTLFGSASGDASRRNQAARSHRRKTQRSPLRAYISLGADAHFTAYNIFIDNHLFRDGTDLSLEPLGYDLSASLMFEWKDYHLGYKHIARSAEFDGDSTSTVGSFVVGWSIGR